MSESLISFFQSTTASASAIRSPPPSGWSDRSCVGAGSAYAELVSKSARSSRPSSWSGRLERESAVSSEISWRSVSSASDCSIVCMPRWCSGLHDRVDLLDLPLADEVPCRVVGEQDLERGNAAVAVARREQRLRDDALERAGDLHAHLLLLRGREDVDDAVDRARGALRVQRAEHEVAGLGRREGGRDRLEVAHLADEDHVGVLAQRRAQALGEVRRVEADLALVDDALLVPVHELDGVLDREDVLGARAVDLVDERRERRRLPRSGRAGDEHEAARLLRELVQRRRQAELLERLDRLGDEAEGAAERAALEVDVDAEAREPGDAVREVELALDLEVLLLLGREDLVQQLLRVVGLERLELLEPLDVAVHSDRGLRAHAQVQVGGAARHHLLQQIVDRVRPHPSLVRAIGSAMGVLEYAAVARSGGVGITRSGLCPVSAAVDERWAASTQDRRRTQLHAGTSTAAGVR